MPSSKIEPSPKGFGFRARDGTLGEIRQGTDGNMWQIMLVSNGSQRWKKIKSDLVQQWLSIPSKRAPNEKCAKPAKERARRRAKNDQRVDREK